MTRIRIPIQHLTAVILATLLLASTAGPLAAQSSDEYSSPEDFAGFQLLANRYYLHDPAGMRDIVTAASATPAAFPPIMAIAMVMVFDSEDHAEAAFVPYSELMAGSVNSELDDETSSTTVDDLGDDALVFRSTDDTDGYLVDATTLTVLDGDTIYLALTMTANDTSDDLSHTLMDFMLEREFSDDEVMFVETGGSTGGPFALFPTEDDVDILGGMDIRSDQYLTASGD